MGSSILFFPSQSPILNDVQRVQCALATDTQPFQDDVPHMPHGRVFTTEEMEAIWEDLENVVRPSWVTKVPTTLSSSGPKLKSDQWRAVGSLYLPISLIRLWSDVNPDDERSVWRGELLHLTMLLFSAVAVITSRITSPQNAAEYVKLMLSYRQELKRLFPTYKTHSVHHTALHMGDFLLMYGPVHGWWAFPYERVIGMLQRIQTNHKQGNLDQKLISMIFLINYLGEYEETIGRSWHRSSNFRAFFSKASCPAIIRYCVEFFNTLVQPSDRNALAVGSHYVQDDSWDDDHSSFLGKKEKISPELRAIFTRSLPQPRVVLPATVTAVNHIRHRGTAYSVFSRHEGNSGAMLEGSDTPFCIEKILTFPVSEDRNMIQGTWIIIRPHRLAYVTSDPFMRYPHLRMRLWSEDLEPDAEAVPISDIRTHFAKRKLEWEDQRVAVVASLSRVCSALLITSYHISINIP